MPACLGTSSEPLSGTSDEPWRELGAVQARRRVSGGAAVMGDLR
jgi:hypothetical protein